MQIKKLIMASVASCLTMSFAVAVAQSNMLSPMNLSQNDSCTVDGVPTSDVNLLSGEPKPVNCVWRSGDAALQVTLHAGQLPEIQASCKFTSAENKYDVLGTVEGTKAASIKNLNVDANPITFTVMNDKSDPNINVQFILNSGQKYIDRIYRTIHKTSDISYNAGATMTCLFTPLAPMKS